MKISLFMPYFRPDQDERRFELERCLLFNRQNPDIEHIYLLIDDDAEVDCSDGRVTVIEMDRRPTYHDWTHLAEQNCPDDICVLANADIYFDDSITRLRELFEFDPTGFVALSRYELSGDETLLHPNPHWSQDTWAYWPAKASNSDRNQRLNFPLGVPRCDNKVAYIFSVYGHAVYNPCREVRSIHVHETGIRTYDKKGDMRIVGGMAMVHASPSLTEAAPLEIELWPVKTASFQKIKLNKSLEKWAGERGVSLPPVQPVGQTQVSSPAAFRRGKVRGEIDIEQRVVGFDEHWQFPAITEQHAYNQVRFLARSDIDAVYVGFPWATLIDLSIHNQDDVRRLDALRRGLDAIARQIEGAPRVVTVCQHIHAMKFAKTFEEAGITDLFWSHAPKGVEALPDAPGIRLHPFPLYPVQLREGPEIDFADRQYLFSFVGAKANSKYLSQSRTYIIEELAGHPDGLIRDRSSWHYNKVVYDQQILSRSKPGDALVDDAASAEFREILAQSVFTLCPSGTGPNSIRLWEAIVSGSIPVVLADTYKPPCSSELWDVAVVSCVETREAVRGLPERLAELVADRDLMRQKQFALRMLAQRYGRTNFVPDVLALMKRRPGTKLQGPSEAA